MPEGLINEIRAKTDLVDLVSQHLSLTKKGNNYWGVCPFHKDTNPSLSVAADKQIYKCFTCGAGGNAFTFLQNIESISFMEAVVKLAQAANIDVSEYQQTSSKPKDPQKEVLYEIMSEAGQFTSYQVSTEAGLKARELLKERQYDEELIALFGIGVVYGDNQLTNYLKAKGFMDEDLIKADVSRMVNNELKDVFYDRIMFPIHDAYGRLIAFSGRTMDPYSKVKYINTGQTRLYTKGDVVYNYHRAKDAARKAGYVVVSEGVTDTIAFTKAGITETVSLLGVACTDQQVRLLKQCSSKVILAFDGDRAGIEASYKIGLKLRESGASVFVWYNDTGLDPDDALRKNGKEALLEGVEHRLHWYDFILNYGISQYGLESFENKKRVIEFVLGHLRSADDLEKSHYVEKLAQRTQFDVQVLMMQIQTQEVQTEQVNQIIQTHVPSTPVKRDIVLAERNILSLMLHSKQAAFLYRDHLGFMHSDLANQLALIILDAYRSQDTLSVADLLSKNMSPELQHFAIDMDSEVYLDTFVEKVLLEQINIIKAQLSDKGIQDLRQQAKMSDNLDDFSSNLQKAIDLSRRKKEGR